MTIANEKRQVQRSVFVYRCNRCPAEALEEHVDGWTIICPLEVKILPGMMGGTVHQLAPKPGADKHLCPGCAEVVNKVIAELQPPQMVGNELANIPIRTTAGETVMLTRHEYDRWAANGKPPVLDAGQVKVKS